MHACYELGVQQYSCRQTVLTVDSAQCRQTDSSRVDMQAVQHEGRRTVQFKYLNRLLLHNPYCRLNCQKAKLQP